MLWRYAFGVTTGPIPDRLRLAAELAALIEEHDETGRGAQAWLVRVSGCSKSQVKYWLEGTAVPLHRLVFYAVLAFSLAWWAVAGARWVWRWATGGS